LAAVPTGIAGVSGQRILEAPVERQTDAEHLANLAHGRVLLNKLVHARG
jgi:hypothetical protein